MIMFVRFSVSLLGLFMTLQNRLDKLVDSGDCSIMQKISGNYGGIRNEALSSGWKFSGKSSPLLEMVVSRAIT